jgi:hypothetical protein
MSELKEFLKDIGQEQPEADILNAPFTPEPEKATEEPKEDDEDGVLKPRNRREKRLMQKLQEERESSIFLAGKLEAREESKKLLSDEESDYLKGIERIYGTDSPEAQIATDLLKKAIVGARDDAEERAYNRMLSERQNETKAVQEAEEQLDNIIDDIEDQFDVQLTKAQQTSYFELLQKMSPKDKDGNVKELADPHAVWEIFSEKLQNRGSNNQAKALSSRSMVQSGASAESTIANDAEARTLRELGII